MIGLQKCCFQAIMLILPLLFGMSSVARQHAGAPPDLVVGDLAPQIEVEQWLTGESFGGFEPGWLPSSISGPSGVRRALQPCLSFLSYNENTVTRACAC